MERSLRKYCMSLAGLGSLFHFDPRQLGIGKPFGIRHKMDICDGWGWEWGWGAVMLRCVGQKVAVHCLRLGNLELDTGYFSYWDVEVQL